MRLELSPEERDVLCSVLDSRIPEYYVQIRRSIITPYKEDLKAKKRQLLEIQRALASQEAHCIVDWDRSQLRLVDGCLQEALREKVSEIWHTDNSRWRAALKNEKILLADLLSKVNRLDN